MYHLIWMILENCLKRVVILSFSNLRNLCNLWILDVSFRRLASIFVGVRFMLVFPTGLRFSFSEHGDSVRGNQAELKGLKESAGNLEGRIDGAARYFPLDRRGLRLQCGFAGRGVGQSLTFDVGPSLLLSGVVGTQEGVCRDLHLTGYFKSK